MNNQLEQLIAKLCDGDLRNQDEQLQKVASLIYIENVDEWYKNCVTVTQ